MRSPFEIFRKHQKILTVILTGLAMFAFVILGAVPDPGSIGSQPALVAILFAGLFGGIGWIAGINAKKSREWGFTGVIAGLALAVAAMFAVGPQAVVRADTGNIDQRQLNLLIQRRQDANKFVNNVFQRARENGAQYFQYPRLFGFGQQDVARDVVIGELLRREADRLGLEVTDDAVNDFIRVVSQGQVGGSDVKEIRARLDLSESELYDILKQEIKAQRIRAFLYADATLPPESYWEFYRQMNIQQSVGIVPVPVDAFVDKSAEPAEAELTELFATYRVNYPNVTIDGQLDEGRPGFRQPRKVRLAYVEVPYEEIEKTVGEVADDEIEAFYEEYYKTIPSTEEGAGDQGGLQAPILPLMEGSPDAESEDETPTDPAPDSEGAKPDSSGETSPPPSASDREASTENPATSPPEKENTKSPDEPAPPQDSRSSKESGAPESPSKNDSGASLSDQSDLQFVALFDDDPPETPEVAAGEKQPEPAGDQASEPTSPPPPPTPRTREAAEAGGPPKPRELDDELREEIRDQILRRRTNDRMQELVSEVYEYMVQDLLQDLYTNADAEDGQESAPSYENVGEALRQFAEKRGLVYDETPLLSGRELSESEDYPIGRAASDNNLQRSRSVPELAFGAGPTELFGPETVLEFESGSRFVFWKIEDEADYEPTSLDDPGVREQVVKTWRDLKARAKAQQRAEALAKQAEGIDKPLSEIYAEATVTGEEGGQVVSVVHPPRFSWLSHANVSPDPFNRPPPTRTILRSVPGTIGDEFMETVVNELQPGEVGVSHSFDESYYYVVRVDERTYDPSPDFQAFRDRFTKEAKFAPFGFSDYSALAISEIRRYDTDWIQELIVRHNVDFSGLDQQPSRSRS